MKGFLFLILSLVVFSCNNSTTAVKPQVKAITEAVYASGYLVSGDEYEVFSQAEGFVAEKIVADGDPVKRGDVLYILESGQQSSRFDLARKSYAQAVANYEEESPVMREITAALSSARSKMKFDSVNHVRFSNLLERNATTRAEYDRMRLAWENSRNDYLLQQSRYDKLRTQLYLELENARSTLAIAANESGRYSIRSQVDGKVLRTLKEKGELVRRTEALAVVGNDSSWYLELGVDELDIQRVQEGQEVFVSIDAYPGKVYKATVAKIYPYVNRQQQSIRVDAVLEEKLPGFFSGLAVEANILIRRKENALIVPVSALQGNDSLLVQTPEGSSKVKVYTGIRTLEEVEILSGIDSLSSIITER